MSKITWEEFKKLLNKQIKIDGYPVTAKQKKEKIIFTLKVEDSTFTFHFYESDNKEIPVTGEFYWLDNGLISETLIQIT